LIKQRLALRSLGPDRQGTIWHADALLRIGRLRDLEVVLQDDSVSREHAEAALVGSGWVVRDLGSTNGTFLNGAPVGRAGQPLYQGDVLQCGNVLFGVRLVAVAAAAEPGICCRGLHVAAALAQTWDEISHLPEDPGPAADPRRRRHRLALLRIGRECHHAGSLDPFLEAVLWEAAEALEARHGCIALHDPATDLLTVRAAFGFGSPLAPDAWLNNPFLAQAFREERSLLCQREPAVPAEQPGADETALGSLVCARLRSPRQPLGVLCLARPTDAVPFDAADLATADALALAVSGAIGNLGQILEKDQAVSIRLLNSLAQMVELRRSRLCQQPRHVTEYALLLAEQLGLSSLDCYHLRIGSSLLELGKIGLSDALLRRAAGPLSAAELNDVREGVLRAAWLLEGIPGLAPLLPIVRGQHERWDGTGFPDGLAGDQIPLLARVVAVADAFDQLTGDRLETRRSPDAALDDVVRGAGTRFDPAMVAAFGRLRSRLRWMFHQRNQLTDTIGNVDLTRIRQTHRVPALHPRTPTPPAGPADGPGAGTSPEAGRDVSPRTVAGGPRA
jgi:HD-GYP domain-containing protein (c-di-GMP phosphodiesterase class II)